MRISFSRNFIKQVKKLDHSLRNKIYANITLFSKNPLDSKLRNHSLNGKYKNYRSIDITGDFRILYIQVGDETIFDIAGTHSQLYG